MAGTHWISTGFRAHGFGTGSVVGCAGRSRSLAGAGFTAVGFGSTRPSRVGEDFDTPGIQSNKPAQPDDFGGGEFGGVASRCFRKARKIRMYATE